MQRLFNSTPKVVTLWYGHTPYFIPPGEHLEIEDRAFDVVVLTAPTGVINITDYYSNSIPKGSSSPYIAKFISTDIKPPLTAAAAATASASELQAYLTLNEPAVGTTLKDPLRDIRTKVIAHLNSVAKKGT